MPIRDCRLIAIDGTHASGKTTLVHALTAHYRRVGLNVAAAGESARTSPFMEEVVVYGRGTFDLTAEVDVFAAQLTGQLRTARHHQLLIADKTVVNVLAYARMLLPAEPGSIDADVLDAIEHFCRAWAPTYDRVFLTHDLYSQPSDGFRAKVDGLQSTAAATLRDTYQQVGIAPVDVPTGLDTDQRVRWITEEVGDIGTASAG